jgi:phosphoribosylformimino-5-aminoimidazole carboxamide ribotide isomerase
VELYPAIDILDGHAVRLTRGEFEAKKVYDQDPLSAARAFAREGARRLHIVDLDGAKTGAPVNLDHVRRIVSELGLPVQLGGGLRSDAAIADAFATGVQRVILGTAVFTDPDLLRRAIDTYGPESVIVSIDARDGYVATHGWVQATEVPVRTAIERLRGEGVRWFVFTNIDHDGMLDGQDPDETIMAARAAGEGKLILSGGIGQLAHLEAVVRQHREHRLTSLDGVIVGKALYERRFTVAQALQALAA